MVNVPGVKGRKVSAFAVAQERQGNLTLPKSVKKCLKTAVGALHEDEKFNQVAYNLGKSYERNWRQADNQKRRKRKAKFKALKQAKKEQRLQENDQAIKNGKLAGKRKRTNQQQYGSAPEPDDEGNRPLNWYGGPKSSLPRTRLEVSQPDDIPVGLRISSGGSKKKRGARISLDEINSLQPVPKLSKKANTTLATPLTPADENIMDQHQQLQPCNRSDEKRGLRQRAVDEADEEDNLSEQAQLTKTVKPVSSKKKLKSKNADAENGSVAQRLDVSSTTAFQASTDEIGDDVVGVAVPDEAEHTDPDEEARQLFASLIHPYKPAKFFQNYWLKKPLHIKRKDKDYYKDDDWFSSDELDRILSEERVRFGVNIDLAVYRNGKRETLNPAGRAYPAIVWDHYNQGCSVRLLNPQTYSDTVWYLLSTLQDLFGCMVGANVYMTPPDSQGFAPHYDDIEGFVLQLEGKKRWRIYGPRTDADVWPLTSSPNMTQEELGEPILDCVLETGDLLYFPRGAIHQALTQDEEHSLHITVSTHQRNTWSDLLRLMLPAALENATEQDAEFRESLPNDYLDYTGIAFQEQECGGKRQTFLSKVQRLMEKLAMYSPVDGACDLMARKFMHDSLPPCLSQTEKMYSVSEQGEKWIDGLVRDNVELQPETRIRLMRKHCLRIVNEPSDEPQTGCKQTATEAAEPKSQLAEETDNVIRVYYNTDNDRLYHGNDMQYIVIDADLAPAVEYLQLQFPEFVSVEDLPLEELAPKVDIAMQLYDKGLILTETSLEPFDMSEEEDLSGSQSDGEEEVVSEDSSAS